MRQDKKNFAFGLFQWLDNYLILRDLMSDVFSHFAAAGGCELLVELNDNVYERGQFEAGTA